MILALSLLQTYIHPLNIVLVKAGYSTGCFSYSKHDFFSILGGIFQEIGSEMKIYCNRLTGCILTDKTGKRMQEGLSRARS